MVRSNSLPVYSSSEFEALYKQNRSFYAQNNQSLHIPRSSIPRSPEVSNLNLLYSQPIIPVISEKAVTECLKIFREFKEQGK
jgi:hypothetical protein